MLKGDTTAYKSEATAGIWSVNNPALMEIKRSSRYAALNDDWLISKPVAVPLGKTVNSEVFPLKNTSNYLESYKYKFDKPGEYLVSFKASNVNYQYKSSVVRTVKLLITK
jgi:hypothetical protein